MTFDKGAKTLEGNVNLCDLGLGNGFLVMVSKAQAAKEKNIHIGLH